MAAYRGPAAPPLPLGPPQPFWQAQPGQQVQQVQPQQFTYAGGPSGPFAAPPPEPPPPDGRLRSVDELPACFRGVFPFRFFNAIQNDCWPAILESGANVVISAPTGGGAEAVGERRLGSGGWRCRAVAATTHLPARFSALRRAL